MSVEGKKSIFPDPVDTFVTRKAQPPTVFSVPAGSHAPSSDAVMVGCLLGIVQAGLADVGFPGLLEGFVFRSDGR